MSRISNKELAEALTEKHGLSKQDAEKFVAKMFEEIGNGLQSDKQVKVKGLGTFKVVSVASRKSVDVNTGEPIIIDGRDKISFTPDASMRDSVNRPFAQFDTVVLNDGVDFSAIDKKYEESEEEDDTESAEATDNQEETLEPEQPTIAKQTESEPTTEVEKSTEVEESAKIEEKQEKPAKAEEKQEEPVEQQEEPTEQQEEPAVSIESMKSIESTNSIESIESTKSIESMKPTAPTNNDKDIERKYLAAQHRTLKIVCIAAAVVIILLGASAYYLFNQLQLRDNRIENLEAQMLEKSNKKTTAKSITSTIPQAKTQEITSSDGKKQQEAKTGNTELKPTVANEPSIQKSQTEEKKTIDAKALAENKSLQEAKANKEKDDNTANGNYNKDVRIRTGAYNIVGIDRTVTVRAGQTLSSISRLQLGPGMECYIEAVNGGRTEFKAGEKINVPKLKLKKR